MNHKLRAMRKVLLLILMVVCLAGCNDNPVVSGYVVGKEFVPAHTTTHYNVTLKMPQVYSYPNQWFVWVADSCRVRRCRVDEATFDRLNRGQFVTSKGVYYGKKD